MMPRHYGSVKTCNPVGLVVGVADGFFDSEQDAQEWAHDTVDDLTVSCGPDPVVEVRYGKFHDGPPLLRYYGPANGF